MHLRSDEKLRTGHRGERDRAYPRLQGAWLVLARLGWSLIALLTGGLFLASLPAYYATLDTICRPGTCQLEWQLTPAKAEDLSQRGWSLGTYASRLVLHEQTRPVLPLAPGRPERRDYEYIRRGTANLFVVVEPLTGWRQVTPTAQRTKVDYAHQLRTLADEIYPEAEYIRLVKDNLNTHTLASLYEIFPPAEARRIASRFEVHYTPKHGSWLNMAEIEISVFERGCLSRPVGDFETLDRRVKALEAERNAARCTIHWQFTSQKARTKLVDLYPMKETQIN